MLATGTATAVAAPTQAPAHRRLDTTSRFAYDAAIVGLGYVGLPTALQLHAAGRRVVGLDINPTRLADIRARRVDLVSADQIRLGTALRDDRFTLTAAADVLRGAASVLVCVPTPIDRYRLPDLTALKAACRTVVAHAQPGQVCMLTSTTYVGCTRDLLAGPLAERGFVVGRDVHVVFAPERINPGTEQYPQQEVPRVVGGATPECVRAASAALADCAAYVHPVSSLEAAELTKLLENTYRAVNISLANEFADISGALNLDVTEVIDAAATKPYGFTPFRPGAGIGGHCIPCDPQYLLWQLRVDSVPAPMIDAAMASVARRPVRVVRRAVECLAALGRPVAGADILVLGVAYKPGVSDARESPALDFMRRLTQAGARVAFSDDLVERVRVGGRELESVVDPATRPWDLVIVHTVHPSTDVAWLAGRHVLDTTYRLPGVPGRDVL